MKIQGVIVLIVLAAAGCAGATSPEPAGTPPGAGGSKATSTTGGPGAAADTVSGNPAGDPVVATVGSSAIRLDQLVEPMKQADGLKFLLQLAVLQEARNLAQSKGFTINEADIQHERQVVLEDLRRQLLDQQSSAIYSTTQPTGPTAQQIEDLLPRVLQQRGISDAEFRIKLETNACIRKVLEKEVLASIDDNEIRARFNLLYGETVHVHVIRVSNLQAYAEAKRRIAIDDFSAVAMQMSEDPISARIGGDLPPFSLQSPDYPAQFKEAAFALQKGQVSDAVEVNGSIFIIKLIERIAPKAVKFEDEKNYVTDLVRWEKVQAAIQSETNQLGEDVRRDMRIDDPELAGQYKARVAPALSLPATDAPAVSSGSSAPASTTPPGWISGAPGTNAPAAAPGTDSGAVMPAVAAPPATAPVTAP